MRLRVALLGLCALGALSVVACSGTPSGPGGDAKSPAVVDIGGSLFEPAAWTELPPLPPSAVEPIVISPCHVMPPYHEEVPSQNDGKVEQLVFELSDAEIAKLTPAEQKRLIADPRYKTSPKVTDADIAKLVPAELTDEAVAKLTAAERSRWIADLRERTGRKVTDAQVAQMTASEQGQLVVDLRDELGTKRVRLIADLRERTGKKVTDADIAAMTPAEQGQLIANLRDELGKKKYRPLRLGDHVKQGQLLGWLDRRRAQADFTSAVMKHKAAIDAKKAAEGVLQQAQGLFAIQDRLKKEGKGAASELEWLQALAGVNKSKADVYEKESLIASAEADEQKAMVVLDLHEIRSSIDGEVTQIYRQPGEAAKQLEPIVQVHDLTDARIEGMVEIQHREHLRKGMEVEIEAVQQERANLVPVGHMQPVTCIAVSKDAKRPLIVSASEDKTVRVWSYTPPAKEAAPAEGAAPVQLRILPHPVPVRSVACTGAGAETNLCLSGADDGKARLWDLDAAPPEDGKPYQPLRELKGQHANRIDCVAFAPDGKTCVTADDREIRLWDVETGDLRYTFPMEHRGPITSLQYTPQAKLVTAGRDNTLRVWELGEKGAKLAATVERRSGDVTTLGVSADGGRVLFDQGSDLHVLTKDHRIDGVLKSPADASKFTTFALFSPDAQTILTVGNQEGRLQLWRTPTPTQRPAEVRQFPCLDRASRPTCAAFAPDGSFVVAGTQDRKVLVWKMPTAAEIAEKQIGRIIYLEQAQDAGSNRARVWAELPNNGRHKLHTGETVTMVARPVD